VHEKYYNTPKRKVQQVPCVELCPNTKIYATKQGKFAEVVHMAIKPKANIKKLSKTHYQVIKTGEIREFDKRDDTTKQEQNLRKSMNKLKAIIRANFGYDKQLERFITFTYRSNMMDAEKLYTDYKKWLKRMQYNHKDVKFDYVAIAEPQERGAWHIHVLIKTDKPIYWNYNKIGDMWRKVIKEDAGNPQIEEITAKDVGAYFVAYFTTMVPKEVETTGDKEDIKKWAKMVKKGNRLKYYPPYFKFYRCSRYIKRPKPELMKLSDIEEEYAKRKKAISFIVKDEVGKVMQGIQKMEYEKEEQ
jgi:hypothetical protein